MLKEDGTISFIDELVQAVDTFLDEYQARKGAFRNDLERGLVISYVLGMMHCDLELLWNALGDAPVFGGLHPRVVFEDCVGHVDVGVGGPRRALATTLAEELRRRGWFEGSAESTPPVA